MPFKKGQSGNPKGTNQRKLKQIATLLLPLVPEAVAALKDGLKDPDNYIAAAKDILSRVYGKPAQSVSVTGSETDPITITIKYA